MESQSAIRSSASYPGEILLQMILLYVIISMIQMTVLISKMRMTFPLSPALHFPASTITGLYRERMELFHPRPERPDDGQAERASIVHQRHCVQLQTAIILR